MSARPGRSVPLGRVVLTFFAITFVLLALYASGYLLPYRTSRGTGTGGDDRITREVNLTPPSSPGSTSGPVTELALGPVNFSMHLVNWFSPGGPGVDGSGTEQGGPTFGFSVGGPPTTTGWANWTSPDSDFGVDYNEGETVLVWTLLPHPVATA